jgi:cysteinyl-tRNA synthetase
MTLTDVEDKAIVQAKKENLTVEELTAKNEAVFFQDFKLLKIKVPDYAVRASSAVDQAARLITELVEKRYAYWYTLNGVKNAYFEPLKFKGFGKLAHLDMSKWPKKKRRFHKDTYPGTPWNLGDFIIWHGCGMDNVCYHTPVGSGRPAWNIQDAAIVTKHLGFSIDVGCGGIDNLVRHHDYTLAIAEAVSSKRFSRYWLHGAHLFVDGKKMSKSTGNVYYPSELLAKGISGEHLRFFLTYKHYRKKLNFTFKKLDESSEKLNSLRSMVKDLQEQKSGSSSTDVKKPIGGLISGFEKCMNNDLDVKSTFDGINKTINELHKMRESLSTQDVKNIMSDLRRIDSVIQCIF